MGSNAGAIKAGKAYVEIYADKSKLAAGLKAGKSMLVGFGSAAAGAAGAIAVGAAAAGAAIATGLGASVKHFVEAGSAMVDMSARTGASVEALSSFKFAAEQTGATMEDVETAMKKFAKTGLGAGRSAEAGFRAALKSVAAIKDPVTRTQKAMELFGKSGTSLIPMAMDLAMLEQRARDLGLVMSMKDAEAADALGDAWGEMLAVGGMLGVKIGSVLAPALQTMVEWGTEVVGVVGRWVEANKEVIQSFLRVATSSDVLWAGLRVAWLKGVTTLGDVFLSIEDAILPVWQATLDEALFVIGELEKAWLNFGAWFEQTMSKIGDVIFDKISGIAGEAAAMFFDAIGQSDVAENQRKESQRAARERKDLRQLPNANPDFAAIDAATAAARAEVPSLIQANMNETKDRIAKAKDDLQRAQDDFKAAVDRAKAPVESPAAKKLAAAAELDLGKSSVSGTFSAAAAQGMAGSQLDQIATASKQTAKNTRKLANLQPGILFT